MTPPTTIKELLQRGANDAPAISAPGRLDLSYGGLRHLIATTGQSLNALGIGRDDLVAIVLPNGPEMATAFLAIASIAATAPLNPAYTAEEFEFYLQDLSTRLLVVAAGGNSSAIQCAAKLGIPIVALVVPMGSPAGYFEMGGAELRAAPSASPEASTVALVLHTSGTTSRPKIVPLTQGNICASARHIAQSLHLTPADRCLQVMPLFHIHGLIAAVLSSLQAGASVCCTSGFNALQMFSQIRDFRPTWYTAVPTMHQAILTRVPRNRDVIRENPLRFIRSSSAALPPGVMMDLEAAFGCPLIEAYGMTEAAHQMTSNRLPPGDRFSGSVGVAAGPEVGIMDEEGNLLSVGTLGEIVIRGPNVTMGYRNNPGANALAFVGDWLRTGDQGVLDSQGYLRLTGRLKEIINRGGEKISPREVDEVLLNHPAVAQVVAFALPHPMLGEDVAALVVLQPNAQVTEQELRQFASQYLADMKVPQKIFFLEEIPKGATGKLQRIGLAARLGLT